jgi:hypothetical protein
MVCITYGTDSIEREERQARSLRRWPGLVPFVKESGSRSWVLRMQHNGRRRDYGLGSALDVTLTEARDAAAALRHQVRARIDPIAERRNSRKVVPSFESAARECYEALKEGWKNQNYRNWIASMEMSSR